MSTVAVLAHLERTVWQAEQLPRAAAYPTPNGHQTGVVRWFSAIRGYGFIQPDDPTQPDVFVHYSDIVSDDRYRNLSSQQRVSYQLVDAGKGPAARLVRPMRDY